MRFACLLLAFGFPGLSFLVPNSLVGQEKAGATLDLQTLTNLFGKEMKSKEVEALRKSFSDAPTEDSFDDGKFFYFSWKNHGFSMEFNAGKVDYLFLYADGSEGFKQYKGELPETLTFADTRMVVERKLGKPDKINKGDGIISVSAFYEAKGIKVAYVSKDYNDQKNRILYIGVFPPKK